MKTLRTYALVFAAAVIAMAAASCERRPLEGDYAPSVKVIVKPDWQYVSEKPTGMSMYFFKDGEATPRVISTSEVHNAAVNLPAGHWRMFLISQSVYEFASYDFFNMSNYEEAVVRLTEVKSSWFTPTRSSVTKENFLGHEPEHMGVAIAEEFDITPEMVDSYQTFYTEYKTRLRSKSVADDEMNSILRSLDEHTYIIPVVAHDIISSVRARVYINNIVSLAAARAALSGMAQNFLLTADRTDKGTVDQLLENWAIHRDESDPKKGYIEAQITSLGLPEGETEVAGRDSTLNYLGLHLLLRDGQILKYDFPVGHKFKITKDETGLGLRLNLYLQEGYEGDPKIDLPDVVVDDDGGGFKADVDDWEDEVNVDIPI